MIVRDLIKLDAVYQEMVSSSALIRLKKLRIGFRLAETAPSLSELTDHILMNEIVLANIVLPGSTEVRVPTWMSQDVFNRFIAKILLSCN